MLHRNRRQGRKLAFQAVFMLDARQEWDIKVFRAFLQHSDISLSQSAITFALELVTLFLSHREAIDAYIQKTSSHWRLERMRSEDRNLLRLGITELWYSTDTPPKVILNEWIELTKMFGGEDSPRFINGILDDAWTKKPAQNE